MTHVLDVDSHWTFSWDFDLERGPLRRFRDIFKNSSGALAYFMAGDLLRSMPPAMRPDMSGAYPPYRAADGTIKHVPEFWKHLAQPANADDRIAWMDGIGIDYCLVNPGGYAAVHPLLDDRAERATFIRECNDALADELEGYQGRLGAIAVVDTSDMDGAIAEITRMRGRGSRSYVLRTEAVNGFSPAHSHWDRLWSATVDLGMIVTFHIGHCPAGFGDMGNIDWERTSPNWHGALLRYANAQPNIGPERFLNALLYGGVFERHPKLTILVSELTTGWVRNFMERTDLLCSKGLHGGIWGEWPYSLSGGAFIRRNVKITPLPGLGDTNAMELLRDYPEMIVFSSDYPHAEGNADPVNLYRRDGLDGFASETRSAFLGTTIRDCFRRTGDPIF